MVFINCKEANLISFTLFSILFERFEQRNTGISPSKDKKILQTLACRISVQILI